MNKKLLIKDIHSIMIYSGMNRDMFKEDFYSEMWEMLHQLIKDIKGGKYENKGNK